MKEEMTGAEKQLLRKLLSRDVMQKAIHIALGNIWTEGRGKSALEESAAAYHHHDGACDLVNKLFSLAEVQVNVALIPRKLNHRIV